MKSRGAGRAMSPTTEAIVTALEEKRSAGLYGKDNGFLLELEGGETLAQIRPKLATAGKKLTATLGSETRQDERALWIWLASDGRTTRTYTRRASSEEPADDDDESTDDEEVEDEDTEADEEPVEPNRRSRRGTRS